MDSAEFEKGIAVVDSDGKQEQEVDLQIDARKEEGGNDIRVENSDVGIDVLKEDVDGEEGENDSRVENSDVGIDGNVANADDVEKVVDMNVPNDFEETPHDHHTTSKKPKKIKKPRKKRVVLLICDPQCDFIKGGAIPILGAGADAIRLSDMIMKHFDDINEIFVSLNSKHKTHISNPICWRDEYDKKPAPMTVIRQTDILTGKFRARLPDHQERYLQYVTALETAGKECLILWPDHCLVGTEGHAVIPEINNALQEWAGHNLTTVEYILKGANCFTEMYSAISAEIPQADDISTSLDTGLISRLTNVDRLVIAGQSLSHTVNQTVRDLIKEWPKSKLNRIYIAKDCCTSLPGFESHAEFFLNDVGDKGVTIGNAHDALYFKSAAELEAEAVEAARVKAAVKVRAAAIKLAEEQRAAAAAAQALAIIAAAEAKEVARLAAIQAIADAKEAARQAKIQAEAEAKERDLLAAAEVEMLSLIERERKAEEDRLAAIRKQEEEEARIKRDAEEEAILKFERDAEAERLRIKGDAEASRLKKEADVEAERQRVAAEEEAERERIEQKAELEQAKTQEVSQLHALLTTLADDASCDATLAKLVPRMRTATTDVRSRIFEEVSTPATALITWLNAAVSRIGGDEGYSTDRELRVKNVLELLMMLLESDGYCQYEEEASPTVHMNGLKERQQAVVDAGGSESLISVLSLGVEASDALYELAAKVVGRMCRATDLRQFSPTASPNASPLKKSKKIKTVVCVPAQDAFIPHAKTLSGLVKLHGNTRDRTMVISLCAAIIHIAQENPSAQRRFLDMQGVTVLHEQLKSFPADYAEFSEVIPESGDISPRQLVIEQKSYIIQALKLVLDPSHRRSKSVNNKVKTLIERILDNAAEDQAIKDIAQDVLTYVNPLSFTTPFKFVRH